MVALDIKTFPLPKSLTANVPNPRPFKYDCKEDRLVILNEKLNGREVFPALILVSKANVVFNGIVCKVKS